MCLLKRHNQWSIRGKKINSRGHFSLASAEIDLFHYRHGKENPAGKKSADEDFQKLINSESPPDSVTVINDSNNSIANQTISSLSMSSNSTHSATRKRKEMSSSRKFLLNRLIKSRNPQN